MPKEEDCKTDYKSYQQKWEQHSAWAAQNPEEWAKNELENNEELLSYIEAELAARLEAQQQGFGVDEDHGARIRELEGIAQTVRNRIAWCKGEYEYDGEGGAGGGADEVDGESEIELIVESDSDMEDLEMGGGA